MTVNINLQPERTPCWNTHISQTNLGINEIKIVMQAFAASIIFPLVSFSLSDFKVFSIISICLFTGSSFMA